MLKALKKEPSMKWKYDITPMVPPKFRVYYKLDQSQDQVLKNKKKHRNNKSRKNKVEECEQGSPEVITIQQYGINKEESEEIWGA
jgi:hypothetical protein